MNQSTVLTLYVNPATGNDSANGTQNQPLKTLTQALQRATAGITIQLAPGTYSAATGEQFPLKVAAGVTIIGNEASKGRGLVIEGGGNAVSPTLGPQAVTIWLGQETQLRGVTVINRATRGTGVWIESTTAIVAHSTLTQCGREGVLATGTANPLILNNVFLQNTAAGLSWSRTAKGEIRGNLCQKTGYGITIADQAAPLIAENQLLENRSGLLISGNARPVLRQNTIARNTGDGLVVSETAVPDLGNPQEPAGNVLQQNGGVDLRNGTTSPLICVGNTINPVRVAGKVEFPASLLAAVLSLPTPGTPPPLQPPVVTPPVTPSQFPDVQNHWAAAFIQSLLNKSVFSGFADGTFKPEASMTRAQFAAACARAFKLPKQRAATVFQDVPTNFWAYAAIAQADQMGFIAGYPDGTFRPNQNLTRIQAIIALVSGLGLTGGSPDLLLTYSDRAQIPSFATPKLATATQRQLVVNYPQVTQLNPLRDATRAEVAAFLHQALVAIGQATPLPSPYIVVPQRTAPMFSDLEGHWAAAFIQGLSQQQWVTGYADGSFQPDAPISRAQYAALLAKAFQPTPTRTALPFTDVPADFWAAAAIQQVYQGGLMMGFADNTFRPDQPILRVHVIASLASALGLPRASETVLAHYLDRDQIPVNACAAIAAATQAGMIVNYPAKTQLHPKQAATRAEVATMLYQALCKKGRLPAIESPYIVSA